MADPELPFGDAETALRPAQEDLHRRRDHGPHCYTARRQAVRRAIRGRRRRSNEPAGRQSGRSHGLKRRQPLQPQARGLEAVAGPEAAAQPQEDRGDGARPGTTRRAEWSSPTERSSGCVRQYASMPRADATSSPTSTSSRSTWTVACASRARSWNARAAAARRRNPTGCCGSPDCRSS